MLLQYVFVKITAHPPDNQRPDLCVSGPCLFVPFGKCRASQCGKVTVGQTDVAVEIGDKICTHFRVGAVTVHTEARELGHPIFSSVTSVQYLAIVRLFFVNEPHNGFLL
jgi:hypothetical protein